MLDNDFFHQVFLTGPDVEEIDAVGGTAQIHNGAVMTVHRQVSLPVYNGIQRIQDAEGDHLISGGVDVNPEVTGIWIG